MHMVSLTTLRSKVNQFRKVAWKQTDGQTDGAACVTLCANVVGKQMLHWIKPTRLRSSLTLSAYFVQ